MLAAVDVDYRGARAVAAAVLFDAWGASDAVREVIRRVDGVAPYRPGAFFERELPCLLAVLRQVPEPLQVVLVDGYVWLDAERRRPGLGAHLHRVLGGGVAVVGVAKKPFVGADGRQVLRGHGRRPLHVTAQGVDVDWAAAQVATMHGPHRIPTLLKRADRLARQARP